MKQMNDYWRSNIKYLIILCGLAFLFAIVCPILLVDQLNAIVLGGIPLGFWMCTQGVYVFIITLIVIYIRLMNKLDEKHGLDE